MSNRQDYKEALNQAKEIIKKQQELLQVHSNILGAICLEEKITQVRIPLIQLVAPGQTPFVQINVSEDYNTHEFVADLKVSYK